jgi:flagellum-specific ATP synthase
MPDIVDSEHLELSLKIKKHMAVYEDARDLINIGAYVPGNNQDIDTAIQYIDAINTFLSQRVDVKTSIEETIVGMRQILSAGGK